MALVGRHGFDADVHDAGRGLQHRFGRENDKSDAGTRGRARRLFDRNKINSRRRRNANARLNTGR